MEYISWVSVTDKESKFRSSEAIAFDGFFEKQETRLNP